MNNSYQVAVLSWVTAKTKLYCWKAIRELPFRGAASSLQVVC